MGFSEESTKPVRTNGAVTLVSLILLYLSALKPLVSNQPGMTKHNVANVTVGMIAELIPESSIG
jgi:hypothetical protein